MYLSEVKERLKSIPVKSRNDHHRPLFNGENMKFLDLNGVNLSWAGLAFVDLSYSTLLGADLTGVCFCFTEVWGTKGLVVLNDISPLNSNAVYVWRKFTARGKAINVFVLSEVEYTEREFRAEIARQVERLDASPLYIKAANAAIRMAKLTLDIHYQGFSQ